MSNWTSAFHRKVLNFKTAFFPFFRLKEDLKWLEELRVQQDPVGVVLHGARIIEVLACTAQAKACTAQAKGKPRSRRDPESSLHSALQELNAKGLLPGEHYQLLRQLRLLGNAARHVFQKITPEDAEQAHAIVLRGLQWYFCDYPGGEKLSSVTAANRPLDELLPANVASLLRTLEKAHLSEDEFQAVFRSDKQGQECLLLLSPVFAGVLAERLLDAGQTQRAQLVLTRALKCFANDIRLRQLQGLLWSRTGQLDRACKWLQGIQTGDLAADEETKGILAGAYKRRASAEPGKEEEWLGKSLSNYKDGWFQSNRENTYLGINAAALALWLNPQDSEAIKTVERVRILLELRARDMERGPGQERQLNCWDQLTLAEAYLLQGEWEKAKQAYAEAQARFSGQTGALKAAREQGIRNLKKLGMANEIGRVFPN